MMPRQTSNQAGLVLINALLLVTALAAVAVFLLQRGQDARVRQVAIQEVTQAQAYLDGVEALVVQTLSDDARAGSADHLAEAWAKGIAADIDRGRALADVYDLQARFSLSWLAGGEGAFGADMFQRLLVELGLPSTIYDTLTAYMSDGGPDNLTPYLTKWPPVKPPGGRLGTVDELLLLPGLTENQFLRLRPFITVAEVEPVLNINTTPLPLLKAAMPNLAPGAIAALVDRRQAEPFETDDDLALWFAEAIKDQDESAATASQFSVSSRWFGADISANLGQTHLARQLILRRSGETGTTRVELRIVLHPDQGR